MNPSGPNNGLTGADHGRRLSLAKQTQIGDMLFLNVIGALNSDSGLCLFIIYLFICKIYIAHYSQSNVL